MENQKTDERRLELERRRESQRAANAAFSELSGSAGLKSKHEFLLQAREGGDLAGLCAVSTGPGGVPEATPALSWAVTRRRDAWFALLLSAGMSPLDGLRSREEEAPLRMSELPSRLIQLHRFESKTREFIAQLAGWAAEQPSAAEFDKALAERIKELAPEWMWMRRPGAASAGEVRGARLALFFSELVSGERQAEAGLAEVIQVAKRKAGAELESSAENEREKTRQALALSTLAADDAEMFELIAPAAGLSRAGALDARPPGGKTANWLVAALRAGAWSCAEAMIKLGANPWLSHSITVEEPCDSGRGNPLEALSSAAKEQLRFTHSGSALASDPSFGGLLRSMMSRLSELEPEMGPAPRSGGEGLLAGALKDFCAKAPIDPLPKAVRALIVSEAERALVSALAPAAEARPAPRL